MNPALAAAAFLISAAVPAVAQLRKQMLVEEKTSTTVEVTSVFSAVAPTGYAPLRVKAVNNLTVDFAVNISTVSEAANPSSYNDAHELESRFSFTAAAGKTTEREFLVPLCTNPQMSVYDTPELRTNVQAGGKGDTFRFPSGGMGTLPFTAFSTVLAGKSIADINNAAESSGSSGSSGYRHGDEKFAALYDPAQLSADWRAYSGLDALAISDTEWTGLQPNIRSAILQWVKLGGSLNLYTKQGYTQGTAASALEKLGIPAQGMPLSGPDYGGVASRLGNGRVCGLQWDGTGLTAAAAKNYLPPNVGDLSDSDVRRRECALALSGFEQAARNRPSTRAPVVEALGEKSFAAWQVGVILFIFGIVVGPVNLFYFAGKGRRHRLFFTTPIISLAAAALLLVVIFFQDGTGGTGHRASLVYLDSADNSAYIHQMQASRTGVLFGATFPIEDNTVLNMGILPDTRWTRLKGSRSDNYRYGRYGGGGGGTRGESQRYSIQDKSCGGDWFQSRSEQAQFVDAVQSTRGRIELKPGSNPPVISSTLTAPLERVFYRDAANKLWASPGSVNTGAEIALTEVTEAAFDNWRSSATATLPKALRESARTHDAGGFFYAASSDPKAGMVETLDSIDWETNAVFLYGPMK